LLRKKGQTPLNEGNVDGNPYSHFIFSLVAHFAVVKEKLISDYVWVRK